MRADDDAKPRDEGRPNPEALLDRYQLRDEAVDGGTGQERGRLRIYVGMAAGVGKTYAMLNEGQRRKARGAAVVVGYVETHNRPLTQAQLGDLEVIPRKRVVYRGVALEEMDTDAILARYPAIALVDELAHTNVPGSRHEKRWQDVEELLDAGITVISTLNIQHLESLNDLIEAITGVRQRETLPDRVLDEADEVELVDISPEALRARLRHGNVYPPDRAQRALEHYFSQSNLTALRELALRRIAEKTSAQLEDMLEAQEQPDAAAVKALATDRVLVAFDARPHAQQLIRAAWRLARGLKAPLLAVTVLAPGEKPSDTLAAHIQLAEDLGAEVLRVEGRDVAEALTQVAQEHHATQLVLGHAPRSRWQTILHASVLDTLLRMPLNADIHVVLPPRAQS